MDWNWKRFAIGAEIEVIAIWVHALIASALYHFTTAIATSVMQSREGRREFQISRIA